MVADMAFEDAFLKPFAFMPAVFLARRLNLIAILRPGNDVAAVARAGGMRPGSAGVLLQLLEQAGVVVAVGDQYRATELGQRVLSEGDAREFLDPIFRFFELIAPGLSQMSDQSSAGKYALPMDWPPSNGKAAALFESFMADTAPYVATWLDELLDWDAIPKVLDVGGGDGTIMAMLCARYPSLSATVFNLPWSESLIRATADGHQVADQLTAHRGDFLHDELPTGFDVVVFARMLSDWPDDVVARLLQMARKSLLTGGRIVAVESDVPADAAVRDKPTDLHPWALFWELYVPGFGLHGPRTEREWRDLAGSVGLVPRLRGRCGRLPFPSLTAIEFIPSGAE